MVVERRPVAPVAGAPAQEALPVDADEPKEAAADRLIQSDYARLETTHSLEQLDKRLLASDYSARTY